MNIYEANFAHNSKEVADKTPKNVRRILKLGLITTLFIAGCSSESQTNGATQQAHTAEQGQVTAPRPSPTLKPMQQMKQDFNDIRRNFQDINTNRQEINELRQQRIKNVNAKKAQKTEK